MLNTMATSLFSRSRERISLGLLLALIFLPDARGATLINDGTTTDGLARMVNATNLLEEFFGPVDTTLSPDGGLWLLPSRRGSLGNWCTSLHQSGQLWFSAESAPTNGVYRVAADFRPPRFGPSAGAA